MLAAVFNNKTKQVDVKQVPTPIAEANDQVVNIRAAALNHRDVWITKGMYPGIVDGIILGSDAVGSVDGRDVLINPGLNWGTNEQVQGQDFKVLGMPDDGTFADHIAISSQYIHDKPAYLTDHEAAALPLAGVTAYRTLITRCQVQPGDHVLVTGIGGGVALMAAQMAIAMGCKVYVTSGSQDKIDKAVALGAVGGANYKSEDWHRDLSAMSGGMDVIIDSAGGDSFQFLVKLCKPGARIGFYGAGQGKWTNINPQLLFWRQVSILGSTMGSDLDFVNMLHFVSEHSIRPVIDQVFRLSDIHAAFDRMAAGNQFGKIVVEI